MTEALPRSADSLQARLHQYACSTPQKLALVAHNVSLNYQQLDAVVGGQAEKLALLGVTNTSIIGVRCAVEIPHLVLCLAASRLGATIFSVPTYESEAFQKSLVSKCGANLVLDETECVHVSDFSSIPFSSEISGVVSSYLFATSGTTGESKLVESLDCDIVAQAHRHVNSSGERFACIASIEHNFAKRHRLYCLAQGATNIFLEPEKDIVDQVIGLDVNVLHVSAFQAQQLLSNSQVKKLGGIRLKLGGSHVPLELRAQLKQAITPNLQAGYGTTETGAIGFTDPDDENAGESVGKPLPGIEVRIVDPKGQVLAAGQRGEIQIRCAGMFQGYFQRPELTAARLVDDWFHTGDTGYLDSENRIHLVGRLDDMFVFNSINIYPQELESYFQKFAQVKEVSIVPKESSVHGSIPIALIVFQSDVRHNLDSIKKTAQKELGLRSPKQYIVVDELPRNPSGKINRGVAVGLTATAEEVRKSMVDTLVNLGVEKQMGAEFLSDLRQNKTDLKIPRNEVESIVLVGLLVMLEVEYDTIITPGQFLQLHTFSNVIAYVMQELMTKQAEPSLPEYRQRKYYPLESPPYLLRFFQRLMRVSKTVTALNKGLDTLYHRLTPGQCMQLKSWLEQGQLIPETYSNKYCDAVTHWLSDLFEMMDKSGKEALEAFEVHRLSSCLMYYVGTGRPKEKTLLVCFAPKDLRKLIIPNCVLLQHLDASRFDLLMVGEPTREGYEIGLPMIGGSEQQVVDYLANLSVIKNYKSLRTIGCSAGGHLSIIAAYRMRAELCVTLGGRFHKERYLLRILKRLFVIWVGVQDKEAGSISLILSFSRRVSRDRIFAKIMRFLTGGSLFSIAIDNNKFSHPIVDQMLELDKLSEFLSATILCDLRADKIKSRQMNFPGGNVVDIAPKDIRRS